MSKVAFLPPRTGASSVPEPDWPALFADEAEATRAAELWRLATADMAASSTLSPANAPALKRWVVAQVMYERAAAQVAAEGPVLRAKRTGTPAHSAWWTVLRDADATAAQAEEKLGLSPRSRGRAAPAKSGRKPSGADRYFT
jgi:P27 family predicted phage terminase small subunit